MSEKYTGVFPVFNNEFKFDIGTKDAPKKVNVADLESFSVSFSNGIENWNPMDTKGWQRGLMTSKSLKIEFKGKRNIGDEGNDYIASLAFKTGKEATIPFEWTMVSGAKLALVIGEDEVKNQQVVVKNLLQHSEQAVVAFSDIINHIQNTFK